MKLIAGECHRFGYVIFILCLIYGQVGIAGPGESTKTVTERMDFARSILEKALSDQDSSMLAEAYYLYGKAFGFAGQYTSSQRYFLHSLQIQDVLRDTLNIVRLYVRLCENEHSQGHHSIASQYAVKALVLSQKTTSSQMKQTGYNAMGQTHENLWEEDPIKNAISYDSAHYYYRKLERIVEAENNQQAIAAMKFMLGRLFYKNGDKRCFDYLTNALRILDEEKQYGVKANIHITSGMAHMNLGDMDEAYKHLQAASEVIRQTQINEVPVLISLYNAYVSYFKKIAKPDSTIVYLEHLQKIRLTQAASDKENILYWLQQEHELKEQKAIFEHNSQLLNLQKHNLALQKKLLLFFIAVTIMAVIAGIFFFALYRKNQRTSLLNGQLLKEQNHRIKNNLQAVSALLQLQSRNLTDPVARSAMHDSELRVQAIALLQRKLYDERLGPEVNLKSYLTELTNQILAACGYSQITKNIKIDDLTVTPEYALPLALILNELITNACKHAFPDHPYPVLDINCYRISNRFYMAVGDNGEGVRTEQLQSSGTFGFQLIKMQAEQLYAQYHFGSGINGTGTVFRMDFTINS